MNDIQSLAGVIADMVFPPVNRGDCIVIDMRKIELQKLLMQFAMEVQRMAIES